MRLLIISLMTTIVFSQDNIYEIKISDSINPQQFFCNQEIMKKESKDSYTKNEFLKIKEKCLNAKEEKTYKVNVAEDFFTKRFSCEEHTANQIEKKDIYNSLETEMILTKCSESSLQNYREYFVDCTDTDSRQITYTENSQEKKVCLKLLSDSQVSKIKQKEKIKSLGYEIFLNLLTSGSNIPLNFLTNSFF